MLVGSDVRDTRGGSTCGGRLWARTWPCCRCPQPTAVTPAPVPASLPLLLRTVPSPPWPPLDGLTRLAAPLPLLSGTSSMSALICLVSGWVDAGCGVGHVEGAIVSTCISGCKKGVQAGYEVPWSAHALISVSIKHGSGVSGTGCEAPSSAPCSAGVIRGPRVL